MPLTKQMLEGNVDTLLLAQLCEGPSYGYALVRSLNEQAQGLFRLGEGTVYPVLHRLEERGLIGAKWRPGDKGRERKYYHLTPKGRRALAHNVAQWRGLGQVIERVLGQPERPAKPSASATT